jgi:hypothetical protein
MFKELYFKFSSAFCNQKIMNTLLEMHISKSKFSEHCLIFPTNIHNHYFQPKLISETKNSFNQYFKYSSLSSNFDSNTFVQFDSININEFLCFMNNLFDFHLKFSGSPSNTCNLLYLNIIYNWLFSSTCVQYFKFSGSTSNNCANFIYNTINIKKLMLSYHQYFKFSGTPSNNGGSMVSKLYKIQLLLNDFSLICQYLKFACSGEEKCNNFSVKKWIKLIRTNLQTSLRFRLENML